MTSTVAKIAEVLLRHGPELAELVYRLVLQIVTSPDPELAAKRALKATASKRGSMLMLRRLFGGG